MSGHRHSSWSRRRIGALSSRRIRSRDLAALFHRDADDNRPEVLCQHVRIVHDLPEEDLDVSVDLERDQLQVSCDEHAILMFVIAFNQPPNVCDARSRCAASTSRRRRVVRVFRAPDEGRRGPGARRAAAAGVTSPGLGRSMRTTPSCKDRAGRRLASVQVAGQAIQSDVGGGMGGVSDGLAVHHRHKWIARLPDPMASVSNTRSRSSAALQQGVMGLAARGASNA